MTHELYNRMTLREWKEIQKFRDRLAEKKKILRDLQKEVRSEAQKVNDMLDTFGRDLERRLR